MKKTILTLISTFVLFGCANNSNEDDISYEEIKPYTYDEIMKNRPKPESNLTSEEYVKRITYENEDNGYSEEFLTSLLDEMGNDKDFFYQVNCHREMVTKQTCVSMKVKIPDVEEKKIHQTEIDHVSIRTSTVNKNLFLMKRSSSFGYVYFEDINLTPESSIKMPVNITAEFYFNFVKDKKSEKTIYKIAENGYDSTIFIIK